MITNFCIAVPIRSSLMALASSAAASVLTWADGFLRREGLNFLHFRASAPSLQRRQQRPCGLSPIEQGVFSGCDAPAICRSGQLPSVGGDAMCFKPALARRAEHDAVAAGGGAVAIERDGDGAEHMGAAIGHQSAMGGAVDQGGDGSAALGLPHAADSIAALLNPELAQRVCRATIGKWAVAGDQLTDRLAVLQRLEAGLNRWRHKWLRPAL